MLLIFLKFRGKILKFKMYRCCSLGYIGHKNEWKRNVKFEYSILNRQEVLDWFLCKRKENQLNCKRCQKTDCNTCNRFDYIRNRLEANHVVAADWVRQPILWQIHENFNKKPNNLDLNKYKFRIYIERTAKSDFLIKKYDFTNDKIIEIVNFFSGFLSL